MRTGTNLTHAKQYNLRLVYETIRLHGPIARVEIARKTELTAQTVSNLVRALMESNLVQETDRVSVGRGAPSIRLSVNPDAGFSIGLDFDQDHLSAVLVDLTGAVRQRASHRLNLTTPEEATALMAEQARTLVAQQRITMEQVWSVGIGVPGPMVPSKTRPGSYVVNPRSLPTWRDVPIDALLEEELGVPVLVENNAMAAAVGERWYGAGQHISTFFYVYFGSGLGGGMVVGGHPYSGNRGNAGELGFIPSVGTSMLSLDEVAGDGTPTGEPLEHSGAFFNLPRLFRLLTQSGTEVSSPDALSALLAQEHPVLLRWIDEATRQLTTLILTVGYLLDPEAIFFGGRLPDDVLRAMLQGVWKRFSEKHDLDELLLPELKLATAGTEAAALGVAALPLHDFLNPQHGLSGRSQDVSVSSRATSVVNEAG